MNYVPETEIHLGLSDEDRAAGLVSVIIPLLDEAENLPILHTQLLAVMDDCGRPFEVIYVDDGSRDGSWEILQLLARADMRVKAVQFRRNYGQTAAMAAGIRAARGEIIVTLDADLQNDPRDIPELLGKLEEGYDVVSGWRSERKDKLLTRRLPSWLANSLISRFTGVHLHDYGCTLKVYRAEVIHDVQLYGEMHRFIPAYAALAGARVTEVVVRHHERHAGTTKYGLSRILRVFLDLLFVKFFGGYGTKPMHFFGGMGFASIALGIAVGALTLYQRLYLRLDNGEPIYVHRNPLILLAAMLFLVGVNCLMLGFLAEILIRIYHEARSKRPYTIRTTINVNEDGTDRPATRD